jgi:hypothetical protein
LLSRGQLTEQPLALQHVATDGEAYILALVMAFGLIVELERARNASDNSSA